MRPFTYRRAVDSTTLGQILADERRPKGPPTSADTQFIAGGTTILDLMKLDVMRPSALIDINGVRWAGTGRATPGGLRLGALARMADVARHPLVTRRYPVIAQSLVLAASAQLRNMATLGGNVLQRTRCTYFRDVSWAACNKRKPGSGCAAIGGFNRAHAVLGVSPHCIAAYPGDFAQALIALDATVETWRGRRATHDPFRRAAPAPRGPARTSRRRSRHDELILAFGVPAGGLDPSLALSRRSATANPTSSPWPPRPSRSTWIPAVPSGRRGSLSAASQPSLGARVRPKRCLLASD